MKIHVERTKNTTAVVEISASLEELTSIKNKVLNKLAPRVKLSGFRDGKAPLSMIEKSVDQALLQTEFLDEAVNTLYVATLREERIRPVGQPQVDVKKFVPFTTLDVVLTIPVVGELIIPNYKKFSAKREQVKIGAKEVSDVLKNLQIRMAEKKVVERAAKKSDETVIDFSGTDAKGVAVKGAEGKDYPLALGSNTFIPGFEDNVIGMKAGDEKTFTLAFPKDYGVKALQNRKVTFKVTVKSVTEVIEPKLDDDFASKVANFKTIDELKGDIKKQLEHEQSHKLERDFEAAIVNELTDKTKVEIPELLLKEQEQLVLDEVKQNAVYRGMTFQEYLENQGIKEEEFIKREVAPEALRRVKAGLLLSEIADIEGILVSPEELEARMQQLKAQYKDPEMQKQLDLPDSRRDINARLRSEKVIQFIKTI